MKEEFNVYRSVAQYSGLGLTMVAFTIICMYVGIFIDRQFSTGIIFSVSLTIIGMIVGGWRVAQIMIRRTVEDAEEEIEEGVSPSLRNDESQVGKKK